MPTTKDWMSGIGDGTFLKDITLPGSHDAGVFLNSNTSNVKCQDRSIYDQLKAGSRFLDLRVYRQGFGGSSTLRFGHFAEPGKIFKGRALGGSSSWGGSLQDEIQRLRYFLWKRDSETVILRFSHMTRSNAQSVWQTIQQVLGPELAVNSPLMPGEPLDQNIANWPLGAVRGKAIACFSTSEIAPAPAAGRFAFQKFKPNMGAAAGVVTCGEYADSPDLNKVRDKQMEEMARHNGHVAGSPPHFFVLYWTQTLSKMGALTGGDIKGMTESGMHAHMNRLEPYTVGPARPSVVLHDFVNPTSCGAIIQAFNGVAV